MVSVEPFMSIPPFPIFMIGVLAQSCFAVSLLPSSNYYSWRWERLTDARPLDRAHGGSQPFGSLRTHNRHHGRRAPAPNGVMLTCEA